MITNKIPNIPFYKMSGCGNDFIVIDNRSHIVDQVIERIDIAQFVADVCARKMSVGADGVILIEDSPQVDFKWRFYNSDGSNAEMCGNGARCAARFAYLNGLAEAQMAFETDAGIVKAHVYDDQVKVKLSDPFDLKMDVPLELQAGSVKVNCLNTGVPHVVIQVEDLASIDVVGLGREIRENQFFAPAGTNVNFIADQAQNAITVRTYERGVEDETLACGTGAVAGAIVAAVKRKWVPPIKVKTRSGGLLDVHFQMQAERFSDVYLQGDARVIYNAELKRDAWHWRSSIAD